MIEVDFWFSVPIHGVRLVRTDGTWRLQSKTPALDTIWIGPADGPKKRAAHWYEVTWFKQLRDHPTLFLEFAHLEKSPEAIAAFADKFGSLGEQSRQPEHIDSLDTPPDWERDDFARVDRWYAEVDQLREAVDAWRSGRLGATLRPGGFDHAGAEGALVERGEVDGKEDRIEIVPLHRG